MTENNEEKRQKYPVKLKSHVTIMTMGVIILTLS